VRRGYDVIGDAYKGRPHDVLAWVDRAVAGLLPGAPVLDLGCGDGVPVARHLVGRGLAVTGVDLSEAQVQRARRAVPGASFVVADMTALDLPNASVAAVVALYSVLHVPPDEQPGLLADIARWLRPGGRLLLVVGETAWTGVDDFFGVPMFFGDAGAAAAADALAAAGLRLAWRHREPEGNGAHVVLLAERPA